MQKAIGGETKQCSENVKVKEEPTKRKFSAEAERVYIRASFRPSTTEQSNNLTKFNAQSGLADDAWRKLSRSPAVCSESLLESQWASFERGRGRS